MSSRFLTSQEACSGPAPAHEQLSGLQLTPPRAPLCAGDGRRRRLPVAAQLLPLPQVALHLHQRGAGACSFALVSHALPAKSLAADIRDWNAPLLQVICHGIPDERKLEEGDIVNLDISVFLNGYHGASAQLNPHGS